MEPAVQVFYIIQVQVLRTVYNRKRFLLSYLYTALYSIVGPLPLRQNVLRALQYNALTGTCTYDVSLGVLLYGQISYSYSAL
jgi:hypothetical protein